MMATWLYTADWQDPGPCFKPPMFIRAPAIALGISTLTSTRGIFRSVPLDREGIRRVFEERRKGG